MPVIVGLLRARLVDGNQELLLWRVLREEPDQRSSTVEEEKGTNLKRTSLPQILQRKALSRSQVRKQTNTEG